jgi:hypothetical protein
MTRVMARCGIDRGRIRLCTMAALPGDARRIYEKVTAHAACRPPVVGHVVRHPVAH